MSKLRVGIIGAGGIVAKLHLPELAALADQCEVALIAGRKTERLARLQEAYNIPRQTVDYADVVDDDAVDAVIIATPHTHHVSWGIAALAAGKHVLMQKPLSGENAEAAAFVEAVAASDRTVMCLPHFPDAVHSIRQRLANGDIGKVTGAYARTSHGGPEVYYREVSQIFGEPEPDELWFFDKRKAGVGALFDMGVYAVSHLIALLGSVRKVTAMVTTLDKPTDLEDTATLLLQFTSGAVATAETSWCDGARTWCLRVHGADGKFELPGANGGLVQLVPTSRTSDSSPVASAELPVPPLVGNMHEHFLACIRDGVHPPLSHAWAARHVTEVLLAGLESAATERAITLHSRAELPGRRQPLAGHPVC
jgi:predicted dehydrogenase